MTPSVRPKGIAQLFAFALGSACAITAISISARATIAAPDPIPRTEGWLVKSFGEIAHPASPKSVQDELAALKMIVAKRTTDDLARYK